MSQISISPNQTALPLPLPRVSVVIPTYNCAQYIVQTLESVFAQSVPSSTYEVLVVDDGSTDHTRVLLAPYIEQKRIQYVYQRNQGESVARNQAIRMARGEYVAFLDSDDWWLSDKLAQQLEAMDAHPNAVLAYGYVFVVNNDGERIDFRGMQQHGDGIPGESHVFERLVISNFITNPNSVMVLRAALLRTGLFDEEIEWGEDWQLWLQMALQGPFLFMPAELACYRMRRPGRRLEIESSSAFVDQNELILARTFKLIEQLPLEQRTVLLRYKAPAYRELWLRSGLYNVESGDLPAAARYFQQAWQIDPDLNQSSNIASFVQQVAHIGLRLAQENQDFVVGERFILQTFAQLPGQAALSKAQCAKAMAELHMAAAFAASAQSQYARTRQHVFAAIRNDPASVGNRGLLVIGIKAVIGRGDGAKVTE